MLEQFLQRAGGRMRGNYGFDWISVVLPIVVSLIQGCFNKPSLQSFVEGRRGALQVAGLKARCRQAARQAGVGPFRALAAGDAMCDAILAECDAVARGEMAGSDSGDIYQAVIDEVNGVMG